MFVVPNQNFRHGHGYFHEGVKYEVPDRLGQYFVNVGWAGGFTTDKAATKSLKDPKTKPDVEPTSDKTPPGEFQVNEDNTVEVMPVDLNIQDSGTDQETEV